MKVVFSEFTRMHDEIRKELDADILLILTAVDKVYINFGKMHKIFRI